jgi:DNA-binding MarR family transcriptional regulator
MNQSSSVSEAVARALGRDCLCLHVQRAGRTIGRRFDDALRPLGLTNYQLSLLISLQAGGPPTIGKLSEEMAMDRTTLTANLKPLERCGLVKIRADDRDRRLRHIVLTRTGRQLVARGYAIWKKVHAAEIRKLASFDTDELRRALRAISFL